MEDIYTRHQHPSTCHGKLNLQHRTRGQLMPLIDMHTRTQPRDRTSNGIVIGSRRTTAKW